MDLLVAGAACPGVLVFWGGALVFFLFASLLLHLSKGKDK